MIKSPVNTYNICFASLDYGLLICIYGDMCVDGLWLCTEIYWILAGMSVSPPSFLKNTQDMTELYRVEYSWQKLKPFMKIKSFLSWINTSPNNVLCCCVSTDCPRNFRLELVQFIIKNFPKVVLVDFPDFPLLDMIPWKSVLVLVLVSGSVINELFKDSKSLSKWTVNQLIS